MSLFVFSHNDTRRQPASVSDWPWIYFCSSCRYMTFVPCMHIYIYITVVCSHEFFCFIHHRLYFWNIYKNYYLKANQFWIHIRHSSDIKLATLLGSLICLLGTITLRANYKCLWCNGQLVRHVTWHLCKPVRVRVWGTRTSTRREGKKQPQTTEITNNRDIFIKATKRTGSKQSNKLRISDKYRSKSQMIKKQTGNGPNKDNLTGYWSSESSE